MRDEARNLVLPQGVVNSHSKIGDGLFAKRMGLWGGRGAMILRGMCFRDTRAGEGTHGCAESQWPGGVAPHKVLRY